MMRSLFSGVSGLQNHQIAMDVIADNIANVNTLGFKAARVHFAAALAQNLEAGSAPTAGLGGTNPLEIGLGSTLGSIDTQFLQGGFQTTGMITDLALDGDALFVLGSGDRQLYSRAGAFRLDRDGRLVDPGSGLVVRGYLADATGAIRGAGDPSDIVVPLGATSAARATTEIHLGGNLDADSRALGTILASRVLHDGGAAASSSTLLTGVESESGGTAGLVAGDRITIGGQIGGSAITPVTFTASSGSTLADLAQRIETAFSLPGGSVTVDAAGRLQIAGEAGAANALGGVSIHATDSTGTTTRSVFDGLMDTIQSQAARDAVPATVSKSVFDSLGFRHELTLTFRRTANPGEWAWQASAGSGTTITGGGSGTVRFRDDGTLDAFAYDGGATSLQLDPGNGAQALAVSLDPGDPGATDGFTQYASASTASVVSQDGYGSGTLDSLGIDQNGVIHGVFSNGVTRALAQIAVARFTNPAGLERVEGNAFAISANSGEPTVGVLGGGIGDRVAAGALEMSNVDLALEFTNMVIAQRGFQANARIISTSDEMLNELVNLKR